MPSEYNVKRCFPIEGHGLVLVPDPEIDGSAFRVEDRLSIVRPDESTTDADIVSIEILSTRNESTWVIVVAENSNIPAGSNFSMGQVGGYKYNGMTVNERLLAAGLLNAFGAAARSGDQSAMIDILLSVAMTPHQCKQTTDAIMANPKTYGY